MSEKQPIFHLIYAEDIPKSKIDEIEDLFKRQGLSLTTQCEIVSINDQKSVTNSSDTSSEAHLILLTHGRLSFGDDGTPYYFCGRDETIKILMAKYTAVWVCACGTANIDTAMANKTKWIRPLVINVGVISKKNVNLATPAIPFITVNWFIAFLEWAGVAKQENGFKWWEDNSETFHQTHPIHRYSLDLECEIRNAIWERAFSYPDDVILYPYHMSFPEKFHAGVFVARCPSRELQLESGKKAFEAYRKFRDLMGKKCTIARKSTCWFQDSNLLPSFEDTNAWYRSICDIAEESGEPTKEQLSAFGACLTMNNFFFYGNNLCVEASTVVSRLLCVKALPNHPQKNKPPTLAVVVRPSRSNDGRMGLEELEKHLKVIVKLATEKGLRVAFFDRQPGEAVIKECGALGFADCSRHESVENQQQVLSEQSESEARKAHENPFVNQLRYLRACIEEYNVIAAIGVHGGLIDVLNVLGVPPNNTYRFFGLGVDPNTGIYRHWQKRTNNLLKGVFGEEKGRTGHWKATPDKGSLGGFLDKILASGERAN